MQKVQDEDTGWQAVPTAIWLRHNWSTAKYSFIHSSPFPHVVIEEFFDDDFANLLERYISALELFPTSFRSLAQKKDQLSDVKFRAPTVQTAFDLLADDSFVDVLKDLSGTSDLVADEKLVAAGIHRLPPGGFTEIHLDANRHPFNVSLHRRLNLIVYFNRDWSPDWGGELILWSTKNNRPFLPEKSILPAFSRAVIFESSPISWHSASKTSYLHAHDRYSLVSYYYSSHSKEGEDPRIRSNVWHSKTSLTRALLLESSNLLLTVAKPYARPLRRLLRTKFDSADRALRKR